MADKPETPETDTIPDDIKALFRGRYCPRNERHHVAVLSEFWPPSPDAGVARDLLRLTHDSGEDAERVTLVLASGHTDEGRAYVRLDVLAEAEWQRKGNDAEPPVDFIEAWTQDSEEAA